jgi:hypothetical protein
MLAAHPFGADGTGLEIRFGVRSGRQAPLCGIGDAREAAWYNVQALTDSKEVSFNQSIDGHRRPGRAAVARLVLYRLGDDVEPPLPPQRPMVLGLAALRRSMNIHGVATIVWERRRMDR